MKIKIGKGVVCIATVLTFGFLGCQPGKKNSARENPTTTADATSQDSLAMTEAQDRANGGVINSNIQHLFAGDTSALALSPRTVSAYLQSKGTSAPSFLAAFQIERNPEHLLTAAEKFPHDPRIQLAVLMHDVLPERAEWIARFKQDAPDNSLPYYIAAHEAFRMQQPEVAMRELAQAAGKPRLRDYTADNMQALEELYLADGRPAAEAKAIGMASALLPHLKMLRELSDDILALQKRYSAANDRTGADRMAMSVVRLGRQLNSDDSMSLLSKMVGAIIESNALKNYPPDAAPAFLSMRVDERLAELQQERQKTQEASRFLDRWIREANERDVAAYFDRMKSTSEFAAIEWLRTKAAAQ